MALQKLIGYDLVLVEDTSHTNIIIDGINVSNTIGPTISPTTKFISPTAFFFYNYACYSIKKNEFLIIY